MSTPIEQYLPSRAFLTKVGFIVITIALIFGIAELFKYFKNKHEQKITEAPLVEPLIVSDITMMDENSDGVLDWKQNLQDLLGITVTADDGTEEDINETEQFARDLFTTAATISQSGDLTEEGAQSIADQVTARIAATTIENLFTEKDVTTVTATDKNKERYAKDLIYLLDQKYPLNIDNSMEIVDKALATSDAEEIAKLEPIIERYTNLIEAFKKLSVPENVKDGHLEFLNLLGKARGSIQTLRNSFNNPIQSAGILMNYPKILSELIEYVGPFTTKIPYSTTVAKQK